MALNRRTASRANRRSVSAHRKLRITAQGYTGIRLMSTSIEKRVLNCRSARSREIARMRFRVTRLSRCTKLPRHPYEARPFSADFHNSFESHPSRKPFPSANLNPAVSTLPPLGRPNHPLLRCILTSLSPHLASSIRTSVLRIRGTRVRKLFSVLGNASG